MKTVKKGRPPRKENRHVVQFDLILRLDCRIPSLLQVKTLLLQSSSCVQMLLMQSCIHIVTRTRFRMQIIVCSICRALVGAYGALTVIIVVVWGAGLAQCQSTRLPPMWLGSIPGLGVISGLSLLVLYSAPRGFSPGTPVFPSPLKPTFDLI